MLPRAMNSSSPVAASDIVRRFAIENRLDPAAVTVGDAPPAHRDGYRLLAGRTAGAAGALLRWSIASTLGFRGVAERERRTTSKGSPPA